MLQIGGAANAPGPTLTSIDTLDDATFWYVINRCNNVSGSNKQYYNVLWSMLSEMDAAAVAGFANKIEQLRPLLHDWTIWAAAKFLFPDMPFDTFRGFQNWIISAGKDACLGVAEHGDNVERAIRMAGHRDLVFDNFDGVAAEVLSQKPDAEQHGIIPAKRLTQEELKGDHWEISEQSLTSRFPKLCLVLGRTQIGPAKPETPTLH